MTYYGNRAYTYPAASVYPSYSHPYGIQSYPNGTQASAPMFHPGTAWRTPYGQRPFMHVSYVQYSFASPWNQQTGHPQPAYLQSAPLQAAHQQAYPAAEEAESRASDKLPTEGQGADHGGQPYVVDIEKATKQNNTYRTAIWTGEHLQVTVMSINVGDDIGLEVHPNTDQFIRIEEGQGLVQMGKTKDRLDFQANATDGYAVMVPAGMWHNITNTGKKPLKVYAIYAPPEHPFGTVEATKAVAMANE